MPINLGFIFCLCSVEKEEREGERRGLQAHGESTWCW
jgi:hypothetical protein